MIHYLLVLCNLLIHGAVAEPLKVFILAGQSNMLGQASLDHMRLLLLDPSIGEVEKDRYRKYIYPNGTFTTHPHVTVQIRRRGRFPLAPGLGKTQDFFGPELEFGYLLGDMFQEPILLIKTAWGGTSLAVDWRPPLSGEPSANYLVDYEHQGCMEECYGARYREMMSIVNDTLQEIDTGYELMAFVWFQGFSDALDERKVAEYADNLENLITQVRTDLGEDNLLALVGELGMHGPIIPDRFLNAIAMRQHQIEAVDRLSNAELILTSPFVTEELTDFVASRVQWRLDRSYYDGQHHYYGKADIMIQIGGNFAVPFLYAPSSSPTQAPSASPQPSVSPSFAPSPLPTRTVSPSDVPSSSPRPSLSQPPSLRPTFDVCDDDLTSTFFVAQTGQSENCLWLRGRPEYLSQLCRPDHPAYHICEETCHKCADFCQEDQSAVVELPDGLTRTCHWVSLRPAYRELICQIGHSAFFTCPETCNNPLCELNRLNPCDDDPTAEFFIESIGEYQGCLWLRNRPEYYGQLCTADHDAKRFCRETCGACVDQCHDDPEAQIIVQGGLRSCWWLSLRPNLASELCALGSEAYEKCQETCNNPNCEANVVQLSPTLAELQNYATCDDDDTQEFLVDATTDYSENCIWLRGNPEYHESLCVPSNTAYFACRETCRRCVDHCHDDEDARFEVGGISRDCVWLAIRTHLHETSCADPYIFSSCGETCNNVLCETAMRRHVPNDKQSKRLGIFMGGAGSGTHPEYLHRDGEEAPP